MISYNLAPPSENLLDSLVNFLLYQFLRIYRLKSSETSSYKSYLAYLLTLAVKPTNDFLRVGLSSSHLSIDSR